MSRARRLAAALLLALATVLLAAAPADAHAFLEDSTPGQGARLDTAPSRVLLRFSEGVAVTGGSVRVLGPDGRRVDRGMSRHPDGHDREVSVDLVAGLREASYTVLWRVVSDDSHPLSGSFAFGVGVAAQEGYVPPVVGDRTVGVLHGVARALDFAGVLLLIGAVVLILLCWPEGAQLPGVRRLVGLAWTTAAVASSSLLLLQGPYGAGTAVGSTFDPALISDTVGTRYGKLALVRLLLLGLLVPLLRALPQQLARRERPSSIDLTGVAVTLLLTFGLGGHPGQGIQVPVAVALDAAHLAAAGVWLGGLVIVAGWLLRPARLDTALRVLPRWSVLAQVSVLVLVGTGLYASWRDVGTWGAYPDTVFGRLLLVKNGLFLLMCGAAVMTHRWLVRALDAPVGLSVPGLRPRVLAHASSEVDSSATVACTRVSRAALELPRVRRAVLVEAGLGAAVLGVAALLVNAVPARADYAPAFRARTTLTGLAGDSITAVIDVPRTHTGLETIRAATYDSAGAALAVNSIDATLEPDDGSLEPSRVSFSMAGPGRGTASGVTVPARGRWKLVLQVRRSGGRAYAGSTTWLVR
jgi:copper transport protein